MPEDIGLGCLGQVRRDVLCNFGADSGLKLLEQRMVDFSACGKEITIDFRITGQSVEAIGELADKAFAGFQLDIVALPVGHSACHTRATCSAGESTGHV